MASTPSCSTGPRTANRSRRVPVMGTAEDNRLRPDEHTIGAPIVRPAVGTGLLGPWLPAGAAPVRPAGGRPEGTVMITAVEPELCRAGGRGEAAWRTRVAEASRPGPFGINEPAGHPASRGPLMSPGFWLHHAALAWRQVFDRRLNLTPGDVSLRGAASASRSTSTGRCWARAAIRCGRPSSASRPRPGPLPDPRVPPTGFEPVPPP